MNMLLAIDNEPIRPRASAIPGLRRLADTVRQHLAAGRTRDARLFMREQRLAPIALGYVATCLARQGVKQKDIEAALLH